MSVNSSVTVPCGSGTSERPRSTMPAEFGSSFETAATQSTLPPSQLGQSVTLTPVASQAR